MVDTQSLTQSSGSSGSLSTSGSTSDIEQDNEEEEEDEERGQRRPLLTETDHANATYGGETTGTGHVDPTMYSPYLGTGSKSQYYSSHNGGNPGVHGRERIKNGGPGLAARSGKVRMETTLGDEYEELFSPGGSGGMMPRVPGGAVATLDEPEATATARGYAKSRRGDAAVIDMGLSPYHDKPPASMVKHKNLNAMRSTTPTDLYADESNAYQIIPRRHPKEPLKTLVAGSYMFVCMTCTAVALALVHEVRPKTKPLPDQILDRVVYQRWGLSACEHLIQLQTVASAMVLLFHKHRFIVVRRVFLMIGTLYLYRALTMWVTALPIADPTYECAPTYAEQYPNATIPASVVAARAFKIITGFGLSINGQHVFCGDYIFSGHTMSIIMGHLIVKEYTPRSWYLLHWMTWVIAYTSIILLLVSRGHYTIDVLIAYFVTTRMWATYHTMVGHSILRQHTLVNHFARMWWYRPVLWFEGRVKPGQLPTEYSFPLPACAVWYLRKWCSCCNRRSRRRHGGTTGPGMVRHAKRTKSSYMNGGSLIREAAMTS